MNPTNQESEKRTVEIVGSGILESLANETKHIALVNAAMIETSKICDYPALKGLSNVILSNGKIVNVVGENYGFISNQEFFGGFEQILKDEHINFKAEYKNVNDSQFTADYILDGNLIIGEAAKNRYPDLIQPKIRLTNSYDGKVKLAGYFGFFRQVCGNGLHVMKHELAFSLRKTKGNMGIVFPNMSQMLGDYKRNEMVNLHRTFETMSETLINPSDLHEVVKMITQKTNVFKFEKSEKNPEPSLQSQTVLNTIARETNLLNVKPNAWIVYNAFNEWVYNEERNQKNDELRRGLDVKLFEQINAILVN